MAQLFRFLVVLTIWLIYIEHTINSEPTTEFHP